MNKKFTEEEKKNIVALYAEGQSVTSLCAEYGIPRSTLYSWSKRFQKLKVSNSAPANVSYKEYHYLKRRTDMLEERWKS